MRGQVEVKEAGDEIVQEKYIERDWKAALQGR